eukprot:Gb_33670 [translate_table: standard]
MAVFIIERIDEKTGTASLFPLLMAGVVSIAYWRYFDDLRPYALVQFIPCIAIPAMTIMLPPKYTHSIYWLWAAGVQSKSNNLPFKFDEILVSCHSAHVEFLSQIVPSYAVMSEKADQAGRVIFCALLMGGCLVTSYSSVPGKARVEDGRHAATLEMVLHLFNPLSIYRGVEDIHNTNFEYTKQRDANVDSRIIERPDSRFAVIILRSATALKFLRSWNSSVYLVDLVIQTAAVCTQKLAVLESEHLIKFWSKPI